MFQIKSGLLQKVSLSDLISSHYSDSLKYIVSENSLKQQRKCHSDRSSPIRYCFAIYMTSVTNLVFVFKLTMCPGLQFFFIITGKFEVLGVALGMWTVMIMGMHPSLPLRM